MPDGILAGMTGSFVVPGVFYLHAIGLSRDALLQTMGTLFALSTLALGVALQMQGLPGVGKVIDSTLALLPAIAGIAVGQRVRKSIAEQKFKKIFFVALLALGFCIAVGALAAP